ncbi:MAG: PAS domain S-box protein [Sphaerochaetaceae bacterium]|nr:PAS domain S-box protein [Sphaerochaetaceae bacterium]
MQSSWLDTVIESSPYSIAHIRILLNENGEPVDYLYLNCNRAYGKSRNMSPGQLIGKKASVLSHCRTRKGFDWVRYFYDIVRYRESDEIVQAIHDDDEYIRVISYKVGELEVAFSFLDITQEMNRAEEQQHLFDLSPALLLVSSKEGILLKVNREWSNFLGYDPANLIGRSVFDLVHEDDAEKTARCIDRLNNEEGYCSVVNRFCHADGSYRQISWRARKHKDRILGTGVDVTETKKKEREFHRQVELNTLLMKNSLTGMFVTSLEIPFDEKQLNYDDETVDLYMKKNRIVRVNEAFEKQYKTSTENSVGKNLYELFSADREQGRTLFRKIHRDKAAGVELRMKLQDGTFTWVYSEITVLRDADGRVVGYMGFQVDINDRKKNELALVHREQQFRLLSEYASDIIWVYNLSSLSFPYVSPAASRILGWSIEDLTSGDFSFTLFDEDISRVKKKVVAWASEFRRKRVIKKDWVVQMRHHSKDGKVVWSESAINFRINNEAEIEIIGISRDISEKKKEEENLLYNSYHDQLTKVYNRRYSKKMVDRFIAEKAFPLSVIICDVNGLKLTNDVFGHSVGDSILYESASLLQSFVREDDIVARYGGDEFIMIMPRTSLATARETVLEMKERSDTIHVGKTSLSISFGYAEQKDETLSFDEVYKAAEHILYRSKLVESSTYKQGVVTLLITSLFSKNREIERHSERVAVLCQSMAAQLLLDQHDMDELYIAGRLHDIGKIGLDEELLVPNDQLTSQQLLNKQRHCELGYHILNTVQNFGKIAEWILCHHEQPDGSGYPRGLLRSQIPLQSHIIHTASSYDNYISRYENPTPDDVDRVLRIMSTSTGTNYDQRTVAALRQLSYDILIGN